MMPGEREMLAAIWKTDALAFLQGRDLFQTWRLVLTTVCAVYAIVLTVRSAWRICLYFSGSQRSTSMMRTYLIVQILRLRFRRFAWEFGQIAVWLSLLLALLYGHRS
jgi:hypothetical protein